jgi:hypothetical protein
MLLGAAAISNCNLFRSLIPYGPPQDLTNEINQMMGQSYMVPEDVDEGDLMAELDALEEDLVAEEPAGAPSYLAVRGGGRGGG